MAAPKIHCSYTRLVPIGELRPHPRNPNRHPRKQIAKLAALVEYHGWRSPITVSNRSGFVVRGHGRLEAAKLLKLADVPVDFQDYNTELDELADLLADNRIQDYSELDMESVDDLMAEIGAGEFDLDMTGFSLDEIDLLTGSADEKPPFNASDFVRRDDGDEPPDERETDPGLNRKTGEKKKRSGCPSFRCPMCGYDSMNE